MINGLFSMSKTQGKASGGKGESQGAGESLEREFTEEEIEASGDAIIIADAINNLAGELGALSGAIREYARATMIESGAEDEIEPERYLDGTKIR